MQSSQFHHPERSHIVYEDFGLPTLEARFGSLSLEPLGFRESGDGDRCMWPRRASYYESGGMDRFYQMEHISSVQNDGVYQSYGFNTNGGTINNGFLNGDPYPLRNRVSDLNPWYSSNGLETGMNNSRRGHERFGYNHDQGLSMARGRGPSILSMARDRELRQQVQKSIIEGSKATVDKIFDCLIVHVCDLMMDPFGNDVVKTLMIRCSSEQITQIVDMVTQNKSQFVNICCDQLGRLAIQSLLGHLKIRCQEDQILRIVADISMEALRLTRSTNANFVILTCFSEFTFSQCRDLLEVIASNFYQIAIDQRGCCMLQKCFDKQRIQHPEIKKRLYREIISHAFKLCLNCYGNYVVQYVVQLDDQHVKNALVNQLLGSFAHLSRNKYGSHAVQKLLELKGYDSRLIVADLLGEIETLLVDPYGNYVIQTAWLVSEDHERYMLKWHIERNIRLMRCNMYGNKILEKLNL